MPTSTISSRRDSSWSATALNSRARRERPAASKAGAQPGRSRQLINVLGAGLRADRLHRLTGTGVDTFDGAANGASPVEGILRNCGDETSDGRIGGVEALQRSLLAASQRAHRQSGGRRRGVAVEQVEAKSCSPDSFDRAGYHGSFEVLATRIDVRGVAQTKLDVDRRGDA